MFVWQVGEDRMWGKMSPNSGLFNRLGPFEDVGTVHELECERRRRFKIANINNLKSKGYSTRITCFKKWICIILPVMAWYNADSYEVVIDITYIVVDDIDVDDVVNVDAEAVVGAWAWCYDEIKMLMIQL